METHLSKIGNSKGIIIPAHFIKECGLIGRVVLSVRDSDLVVSSAKKPRANWEAMIKKAGVEKPSAGSDMRAFRNDFDQDEWTW